MSKKTTPIKKTLNLREKAQLDPQKQFREEKKKMLELKLQKNTQIIQKIRRLKEKLNR